ncbi:PKD domain-containing protein [Hymenobacter wooponensis]|uniref:PKD/Chitinase domain-containing protein n=1 Tax=Hymenobacter wooponensis TaxID=1525360 RepID=A0A4Z0MU84_9BACT|nr:IPT/TIG domain-containing protein [Hymenobacter wooponensis]TGD82878.1 hypothetical protein EU557_03600 [Hymenobacter wooponensis]
MASRSQHKQRIRLVFKVVPGGPADVTRSAPVISALDGIIDDYALKSEIPQNVGFTTITEGQYGTHPEFTNQNDVNAFLLQQVANGVAVTVPPAPKGAQVDDVGNIFSHLAVPGYASASDYELEKADVAAGFSTPTDIYSQGGRIYYPGITGPHSVGSVRARVKASGGRPAGEFVSNATAFTGPVVVPGPTLTQAQPASGMVGTQVVLTGTNLTGALVAFNGTAAAPVSVTATQIVVPVPAGATSGNITATTSAGTATLYFTVTVPAANMLPTANAGADITLQLPTNQVALLGTGSDSDGTISSYSWAQITGPNNATGMPASTQNVVVSGLVAGIYQFRLTVTDDKNGQKTDDVLVTVNAATSVLAAGLTLPSGSTVAVGGALAFTATASGGTSPYELLVQAENTNTGQVIQVYAGSGASYSGSWTPTVAGSYALTNTVTDNTDTIKISPVRTVTVTAAPVQAGPGIAATFPNDGLVTYSFDAASEEPRMYAGVLGNQRLVNNFTYTDRVAGRSVRDPNVLERYTAAGGFAQVMVHTNIITGQFYNNTGHFALAVSPSGNGRDWKFLKNLVVSTDPLATSWSPKLTVINGQDYIIYAHSTNEKKEPTNYEEVMYFQIWAVPVNNLFSSNPTVGTPVKITGSSFPVDIIDPFLYFKDGLYHLLFKNEATDKIGLCTSSQPFTGYGAVTYPNVANQAIEGISRYVFGNDELFTADLYGSTGVNYFGANAAFNTFTPLNPLAGNGIIVRHNSLWPAGRPDLIVVPKVATPGVPYAGIRITGSNETTNSIDLAVAGILTTPVAQATAITLQFYDNSISGGALFNDNNKDGGLYTITVPAGQTSYIPPALQAVGKVKKANRYEVGWKVLSTDNPSVSIDPQTGQSSFVVSAQGTLSGSLPTLTVTGTLGAQTADTQNVNLDFQVSTPFTVDTQLYLQVTADGVLNLYPESDPNNPTPLLFPAGQTHFTPSYPYPRKAGADYNYVLRIRSTGQYTTGNPDSLLLVIPAK